MPARITVTTKPPAQSSTLWLNAVTIALLAVSAATMGLTDIGLDPLWQARILYGSNVLNAVLNGVLRLRTHEPLEGTAGEEKARADEAGTL
jgi:hypothetical protein